ncbi:phospholipase D-like domain-containing protein [Peredibacter starrii]|uniref:Phosphatidylserine/phosphatidylglycerophosphate/ cardiolipin synthase family protein n=1 Tax=Peredibacter starrii TaxID=28202 RepID=A0AAX4HV06_9BACT|nr:phosphatidylserine/phosphatidylglycerophosphate/cardiolipin synthase family protein [Peredibacter starrii]WPU66918.1 phosphatidylserine/phosphatidylglycerophosphate/cardiolipin synthase family protein [Peredibacter starrii]
MKYLFTLLLLGSLSVSAIAEDKDTLWEKFARYTMLADSMVKGSLDSRGLTFDTLFQPNVSTWTSIAKEIDDALKNASCKNVDCGDYETDFTFITNSAISSADHFEILENKRSFELRRELINNAQSSIHVLVWAVYDDETGKEFEQLLYSALERNPEMDIRVIVDGNIANMKGKKLLKRMEKNTRGKIKVIRWKSKKYRANGNHRKLMIVDKKHVIVGGMNIGNNYSHMGEDSEWRDLDLYIRGDASGLSADNRFVDVWNKQLDEFKKLRRNLDYMLPDYTDRPAGRVPVTFVDQHPGSAIKNAYHNIHTGVVKLLRDAQETVDIENAYFIMDPVIRKELENLIKRGVKVRIYTNSKTSVDEGLVRMSIMHSARGAADMGALIYLKKGHETLHSKYMIVDKKISMIGSFNLHPRSLRFDAENVAVIFDKNLSEQLTEHFETGIQEAIHFERPEEYEVDWDLMGILTKSFYFDFL